MNIFYLRLQVGKPSNKVKFIDKGKCLAFHDQKEQKINNLFVREYQPSVSHQLKILGIYDFREKITLYILC